MARCLHMAPKTVVAILQPWGELVIEKTNTSRIAKREFHELGSASLSLKVGSHTEHGWEVPFLYLYFRKKLFFILFLLHLKFSLQLTFSGLSLHNLIHTNLIRSPINSMFLNSICTFMRVIKTFNSICWYSWPFHLS